MSKWFSLFVFSMLVTVQVTIGQGLLGPFNKDAILEFSGTSKKVNPNEQPTLFKHKKLTLLVFLSPDCPLSKNYSVVIQQLATDFAADIQVVGIFPGTSFSTKEIRQFSNKYKLSFPLLIDEKMQLVQAVKASITPEVILMNEQANLIYRGAIDDWAVELGKKRTKASNEYLKDAIRQTLAGIPVLQKINEPVGCLINDF